MAERNSMLLSTREIMPEWDTTAARNESADKLQAAGQSIGDPDLVQRFLDANCFVVCQEMADVANGTSRAFRYYCSFPVILHGAHGKIGAGTTVAMDVLSDIGAGFVSVLDAPEALGGTTTLHEVKPENTLAKYAFDRGDWLEVTIASSGGDSATGIYVDLVLQRR